MPGAPLCIITHHIIAVQCLHSAPKVASLGFSANSLSCVLSCPSLAAEKNKEFPFHHLQETKQEESPGGEGRCGEAQPDLLRAGHHSDTHPGFKGVLVAVGSGDICRVDTANSRNREG